MTANSYRTAYEYLDQYGDNGRGVTKAEHDRRVASTGRNFTDPGYRIPHRNVIGNDTGPHLPEDGKHVGAGDRDQ